MVSQKRKWKPTEAIRPEILYTILLKSNTFMERSQDKGKGFGLLGVANCEKVNMWGKLMEGRGNFSNVCLCRFKLTVISSSWYGGGKGDTFTKRNVCSAFREGRELVLHLLFLICLLLKTILCQSCVVWNSILWSPHLKFKSPQRKDSILPNSYSPSCWEEISYQSTSYDHSIN